MKSLKQALMVMLVAAFFSAGCIQIKKPLVDLGDGSGGGYSHGSGTGTQGGSESQQVRRLQYLVSKYKKELDKCKKENRKLENKIEKLEDQIDDIK